MCDDEIDVTELLGLPEPAGWCNGGKCGHFADPHAMTQQKISKFSCGSWQCRICGRLKRWERAHWYAWRLVLSDGTLHEEQHPADRWLAAHQRLHHNRCQWVCIDNGRGVVNVIYSRPTSPDGVHTFTDRETAVRRLGELIRAFTPVRVGRQCNPISSCKEWKLPRRPPAKFKLLRWIKAAKPEVLAEHLRSLGIEPTIRREEGSSLWSVVFTAPPDGVILPDALTKGR